MFIRSFGPPERSSPNRNLAVNQSARLHPQEATLSTEGAGKASPPARDEKSPASPQGKVKGYPISTEAAYPGTQDGASEPRPALVVLSSHSVALREPCAWDGL